MLSVGSARLWHRGLSAGVPLLLGTTPLAAAGGPGASDVAPWFGIAAAAWAVFGTRGVWVSASGLASAALVVVMLASAAWAWRQRRARRAGAPRRAVATPIVARPMPIEVPAGLDGAQVLDAVRGRFIRLQAAWDAGDVPALKSLTTPDMLEELLHVLPTRGAGPSRTDVISLHAELLGLEELGVAYLASVEFSGLIRESAERGAVPFRELWMLACMKDDTPSWRLARQQSLF